jgi:hypothetical protein
MSFVSVGTSECDQPSSAADAIAEGGSPGGPIPSLVPISDEPVEDVAEPGEAPGSPTPAVDSVSGICESSRAAATFDPSRESEAQAKAKAVGTVGIAEIAEIGVEQPDAESAKRFGWQASAEWLAGVCWREAAEMWRNAKRCGSAAAGLLKGQAVPECAEILLAWEAAVFEWESGVFWRQAAIFEGEAQVFKGKVSIGSELAAFGRKAAAFGREVASFVLQREVFVWQAASLAWATPTLDGPPAAFERGRVVFGEAVDELEGPVGESDEGGGYFERAVVNLGLVLGEFGRLSAYFKWPEVGFLGKARDVEPDPAELMRRGADFELAMVSLGLVLAELGRMREDFEWWEAESPVSSVDFGEGQATTDVKGSPSRLEGAGVGADLGLGDEPRKLVAVSVGQKKVRLTVPADQKLRVSHSLRLSKLCIGSQKPAPLPHFFAPLRPLQVSSFKLDIAEE